MLFRLVVLLKLVALGAADGPWDRDPYPAPCGRSIPSGRCMTEESCLKAGGFYVQRDCTFYDVGDIGCCYR
jgi:hypothetical protein